ncbi:MAG: hypothetical protein ACHQ53_03720, partial [Polyangiales bacterium]
ACNGGGPMRTGFQGEVIEDAERLHAALKESVTDAVAAAIPDIDFGHYVVVAAYAEMQISCDYGFAVTAARELDAEVEVEATIFVPCGILSGAVAWPSAYARIPRRDKPFVFVEKMAPAPGCK